jgi:tRNA-specific 2-thiouridylase
VHLVVGEAGELGFAELTAQDVNWISGEAPSQQFRALVKVRYSAKEVEAWVNPLGGNQVLVKFDRPARDVAAGQAAVFYQGELMLGGGIIR